MMYAFSKFTIYLMVFAFSLRKVQLVAGKILYLQKFVNCSNAGEIMSQGLWSFDTRFPDFKFGPSYQEQWVYTTPVGIEEQSENVRITESPYFRYSRFYGKCLALIKPEAVIDMRDQIMINSRDHMGQMDEVTIYVGTNTTMLQHIQKRQADFKQIAPFFETALGRLRISAVTIPNLLNYALTRCVTANELRETNQFSPCEVLFFKKIPSQYIFAVISI